MNRRLSVLRLWLPVVAWCALIFYLSGIPGLRITQAWWDLILRKLAHMGEYAVLAILLARALKGSTDWPPRRIASAAFWMTVAYAVSDEVHQSLVPQRAGAVLDVVIDAAGALVGLRLRR